MEKGEVTAPEMKGVEDRGQSPESMAELLDGGYGRLPPKRGDAVEGTIVRIRPTEILVDVGYKSEGIVTARDLDRLDPDYLKALKVGDKILAYVLHPENRNGDMILSLSRALMERDWQEASRLFEAEEILEKPVAGFNRGGVIVNLGRVRGFVPASQIASARLGRGMDDAEREAILSQLVGRQLKLKIIEMDRRRNRLILSERAAQREWREEQKARLLTELRQGEVRHGVVSSLCDFGAFVDLGGADGLVHLSELAWRRVRHPREVLSLGQEVDVYVLGVDRERRRIALSLKRLEKEPWSQVEQEYEVGQLITCTVTKLTDFGAFARLDEDIEGLVHISELSDERIEHPSEVLEEGQEVTLRIIRIDVSRQRIGLSLRRAQEEQVPEHDLGESEETQEIEDLSEETGEVEDLSVETGEVEDLPVETREVEDLPVDTGEVEDLPVETGELDDLPVETEELDDLSEEDEAGPTADTGKPSEDVSTLVGD